MANEQSTAATTRWPVKESVVAQRLRRALQKDGETLKKNRRPFVGNGLGYYLRVDVFRNCITDTDVDVEGLARECGVLRVHEFVAWDE